MKTLSIAIDTTSLNNIRSDQTQIIRRAYVKAKKRLEFKTIRELLQQPTDLDGHLYRCGIQRGIDLAKVDTKSIFGGKKNFIRRCKGLITNAEWKALRIMPIYSIGQADRKGNRRFCIDYESRTLTYKDSNNEYKFNIPDLKT
jgi:hypothetical protein